MYAYARLRVRACVRAFVCVRVRARVCACLRACCNALIAGALTMGILSGLVSGGVWQKLTEVVLQQLLSVHATGLRRLDLSHCRALPDSIFHALLSRSGSDGGGVGGGGGGEGAGGELVSLHLVKCRLTDNFAMLLGKWPRRVTVLNLCGCKDIQDFALARAVQADILKSTLSFALYCVCTMALTLRISARCVASVCGRVCGSGGEEGRERGAICARPAATSLSLSLSLSLSPSCSNLALPLPLARAWAHEQRQPSTRLNKTRTPKP